MIDGVMMQRYIKRTGLMALTVLSAFSAARSFAQPAACEGPGCGKTAPLCQGPGCGKTDSPCEGPGCGMTPLPRCQGPGCGKTAPARGRLERAAAGLSALQAVLAGGKPLLPEQRAAMMADLKQLVESGKAVHGGAAPAQKDFVMMANASLSAAKMDAGPRGVSGGRRLGPLLAVTLRQLAFLNEPALQAAMTPSPVSEFLKSADGRRLFQEVLDAAKPADLPAPTAPCSGPGCDLIPPPAASEAGVPMPGKEPPTPASPGGPAAPAQEVTDPMAEATRTVAEATRADGMDYPAYRQAKQEAQALYLEVLQARNWGLTVYNSHSCTDKHKTLEPVPLAAYGATKGNLAHGTDSVTLSAGSETELVFSPEGRFSSLTLGDKPANRLLRTYFEAGGKDGEARTLEIVRDECPLKSSADCHPVLASTRFEIKTFPGGKSGFHILKKTRREPGSGENYTSTVTDGNKEATVNEYSGGKLVSSKRLPLGKLIPQISEETTASYCRQATAQAVCYRACVNPSGFVAMLQAQGVAKTNLVVTDASRPYTADGNMILSVMERCCPSAWTQIKMIWAIEVFKPKQKPH